MGFLIHRRKSLSERYGAYNRSKIKLLTILSWASNEDNGQFSYIPLKRIVILSGISYYSVGKLLKRYASMGYIDRLLCPSYTSLVSEGWSAYKLTPKGYMWLESAINLMPQGAQFQQEVELRYDKVQGKVDKLVRMKFNDMIKELKVLNVA